MNTSTINNNYNTQWMFWQSARVTIVIMHDERVNKQERWFKNAYIKIVN
jgi:hypothetical protein